MRGFIERRLAPADSAAAIAASMLLSVLAALVFGCGLFLRLALTR